MNAATNWTQSAKVSTVTLFFLFPAFDVGTPPPPKNAASQFLFWPNEV